MILEQLFVMKQADTFSIQYIGLHEGTRENIDDFINLRGETEITRLPDFIGRIESIGFNWHSGLGNCDIYVRENGALPLVEVI